MRFGCFPFKVKDKPIYSIYLPISPLQVFKYILSPDSRLGMQHLESEQWTAAIASFEESLQLDPDFKVPWSECHYSQAGWLFFRVGCSLVFPIPQVLEEVLKAPWINMAVAFLRLRQWQQVLEVWILRIPWLFPRENH